VQHCDGKSSVQQEEGYYHNTLDFNLRKKLEKKLLLEHSFMWCSNLNSSESRQKMAWEISKCFAGEGWRRSVGPIV
jgi:hypothetical protein